MVVKGFFTFARSAGSKQFPVPTLIPQRQNSWKAIASDQNVDKNDNSSTSSLTTSTTLLNSSQQIPTLPLSLSKLTAGNGSFSLFSASVHSRLFSTATSTTKIDSTSSDPVAIQSSETTPSGDSVKQLNTDEEFFNALKSLKIKNKTDEWNAVLDNLLAQKKVTEIKQKFQDMCTNGPLPNRTTFQIVSTALTQVTPRNQLCLEDLLDFYSKFESSNVDIPTIVYQQLIFALCQWDAANTYQVQWNYFNRLSSSLLDPLIAKNENPKHEKLIESILSIFSEAINKGHPLSYSCHNKLLNTLGVRGDVPNCEKLLHFMEQSNKRLDISAFLSILNASANCANLESAQHWFSKYLEEMSRMTPPGPHTAVLDEMVKCIASSGDVEATRKFLQDYTQVYGLTPTSSTFTNALMPMYLNKHFDSLEALYKDLSTELETTFSTHQPLFRLYCNQGKLNEASDLFQKMKASKKVPGFYDIAILCLLAIQQNQPSCALSLCKEMVSYGYHCEYFEEKLFRQLFAANEIPQLLSLIKASLENHKTSNGSISMEKLKQLNRLMEMFQANFSLQLYLTRIVQESGFSLNSHSLKIFFNSYMAHKDSDVENALDTKSWNEMDVLNLLEAVKLNTQNSEVARNTIFDILKNYEKGGKKLTESIINSSEAFFLKIHDQDGLAQLQQICNQDGSVMQMDISYLKSKQQIINAVESMSIRITSLCKENKINEAVKLHQQFQNLINSSAAESVGSPTRTSTQLVRPLLRMNRLKEAWDIISFAESTMRSQKYAGLVYNSALFVAASSRNHKKANHYYKKLKDLSIKPEYLALANYIQCQLSVPSPNTEMAMSLYNEIKSFDYKPDQFMLNFLISQFAKARRPELAQQIFDDIANSNLHVSEPAYNGLLTAYARVGNSKSALEVFKKYLSDTKLQPDIIPFNIMMQLAVQNEKNLNATIELFQLATKVKKLQPNARTLQLLIEAYSTIAPCNLEEAKKLLHTMRRDYHILPTASHYATLIEAHHDNLEGARQLFQSYLDQQIPLRSIAFEAIVKIHADQKEMGYARHYRNLMIEKGIVLDPYVENRLIDGYWRIGARNEAEAIFQQIVGSTSIKTLPSTFVIMIEGYLQHGEEAKAQEALTLMKKQGFPTRVVKSLEEYRVLANSHSQQDGLKSRLEYPEPRFSNSKRDKTPSKQLVF